MSTNSVLFTRLTPHAADPSFFYYYIEQEAADPRSYAKAAAPLDGPKRRAKREDRREKRDERIKRRRAMRQREEKVKRIAYKRE